MRRSLCNFIEKMTNLERLTLCSSHGENESLDLQFISYPPCFLCLLNMMGRLKKLPNLILDLPNLRRLALFFSRLNEDPLKHLSGLPNLSSLWLCQAYDGEQLKFEEGGFQKLKLLELTDLYWLKVESIDKRALPLLQSLRIGLSPQLKEVPSSVEHLKNLKLVEVSQMPREFALGLQPQGRQVSWKVKHIGFIHCSYRGEADLHDVFHGQ